MSPFHIAVGVAFGFASVWVVAWIGLKLFFPEPAPPFSSEDDYGDAAHYGRDPKWH